MRLPVADREGKESTFSLAGAQCRSELGSPTGNVTGDACVLELLFGSPAAKCRACHPEPAGPDGLGVSSAPNRSAQVWRAARNSGRGVAAIRLRVAEPSLG